MMTSSGMFNITGKLFDGCDEGACNDGARITVLQTLRRVPAAQIIRLFVNDHCSVHDIGRAALIQRHQRRYHVDFSSGA